MPSLNAPWRQPPALIDPAMIAETPEADVIVVGCAHAGTAAPLWLDRDGNRFCNEGFGDAVLSGVEGARLPEG